MIVKFLDLKTGQQAEEIGITVFGLMHGNWSCDCNRQMAFDREDGVDENGVSRCLGERRYIAYDVEFEEGDDRRQSKQEVLAEANLGYFRRIELSFEEAKQ